MAVYPLVEVFAIRLSFTFFILIILPYVAVSLLFLNNHLDRIVKDYSMSSGAFR